MTTLFESLLERSGDALELSWIQEALAGRLFLGAADVQASPGFSPFVQFWNPGPQSMILRMLSASGNSQGALRVWAKRTKLTSENFASGGTDQGVNMVLTNRRSSSVELIFGGFTNFTALGSGDRAELRRITAFEVGPNLALNLTAVPVLAIVPPNISVLVTHDVSNAILRANWIWKELSAGIPGVV